MSNQYVDRAYLYRQFQCFYTDVLLCCFTKIGGSGSIIDDNSATTTTTYSSCKIESLIPTDNCQLANSCGYTTCTGTMVGINVYNNGTCVCTVDSTAINLCLGCNAFSSDAYITSSGSITGNAATATEATCDGCGQIIHSTYATKNELATHTATFRGSFADWSSVPTTATGYCSNYAGLCAPSANDYMVVQDATGYCASCVGQYRFKYNTEDWDDADGASCKTCWVPEYRVNEVLDTSPTSGSTNGIMSCAVYSGLATKANCTDIPTDNNQLANGCGYITSSGSITGNAATASCDDSGNCISSCYVKYGVCNSTNSSYNIPFLNSNTGYYATTSANNLKINPSTGLVTGLRLRVSSTSDIGNTYAANDPFVIGCTSSAHLAFDANEIIARSGTTTAGSCAADLYINASGGIVYTCNSTVCTRLVIPTSAPSSLVNGAIWITSS